MSAAHTLELLVDGYISQSFSPNKDAEDYFGHLLKTDKSVIKHSYQTSPTRDGSGVIFVAKAIPETLSTTPSMQDSRGRPLWLLDYSVIRSGTVVPQALWSPHNVNDFRQYVSEAPLQMPIFFMQENGILGLSLNDAADGRCQTLRDGRYSSARGKIYHAYSHLGTQPSWPGYNDFKRQVQIRDETPAKNPITIAKFAHHVGRSVRAFLDPSHLIPNQTRRPGDDRWVIGQGRINPVNIRIIGAIHVSVGSWMPILQLDGVWVI
ncbi:hypothetical protein BJV74DRAFT_884337 [Russula compacta]|nr:hypothetical protein BJV74DRAFT_884337 [Russula compacta]